MLHVLRSDASDATRRGSVRAGWSAVPTPPFAPAARRTRTVAEHRAAVADLLAPMPTERVPLREAARARARASALLAAVALPPFDNSAMDGYAVRAADVAGATEDVPWSLPWRGTSRPAARTSPSLEPGTAHRIMTGAPLPAGCRRHRAGRAHRRRHRPRAVPRRPRPATTSGAPARTSRPARSCCPPGRCWAAADRGRRRGRRGRPCRCAAARACWCCPPGPSSSRRARRCARARSTSRTRRCWPPRWTTPAASARAALRARRRRAPAAGLDERLDAASTW